MGVDGRRSGVDDAAVIARVLAGDTEKFSILVERYQRMIHAYTERLLRQHDLADEATQATFVRAFDHLDRFRGESSFKTWLHAVALNECRGLWRSARRGPNVSLDDVPESALPRAEIRATDDEGLERLVERLPARQRSVVALRVYSDLAFKEIARVEGITENSAKVSFHHAIKRLRGWLGGGEGSA